MSTSTPITAADRRRLWHPRGTRLGCLSATHPWFWLVRSAPVGGFAAKIIEMCASAHGAAPAIGLVLLDTLPVLLDALGQRWGFRHG